MAYKSQVTNKYMGSSFAGRVNPGRENELTQLVETLRETDRAITNALPKYKDKQVEKAEEELETLLLTKTPEEVQAIIMSGENPVLSNKYAVSAVDGQLGRFAASDTIRQITENNSKYDFRSTQSRREFYKQFLPELESKSSSFRGGFAVHFNDWQARDLLQDADNKAKFRQESKIQEGVKFLGTAQYEDISEFWQYADSLRSELPSTDGKKNYFVSPEDENLIVIEFARQLMLTAGNENQFELARSILTHDRGNAANGTSLGSLKDTRRRDVAELLNDIDTSEIRFINQKRTVDAYKEEISFDEIMSEAMKPEVLNDFTKQQEFLARIKNVDEKLVPTYKQLLDLNRSVTSDTTVINNFRKNIAKGDFAGDYQEFLNEFISLGIPNNKYESLRVDWTRAHSDEFNSIPPIYETNSNYKRGIANAKSVIKGLYTSTDKLTGQLFSDPNYAEAVVYTEEFMIDAIFAAEADARDAAIDMTDDRRRDLMTDLREFIRNQFQGSGDLNITNPSGLNDPEGAANMVNELRENEINVSDVVNQFISAVPQIDFMRFEDTDIAQNEAFRKDYMDKLTEDVAAKLFNETLPDYLSDNIKLLVSSISDEQLSQLATAYRITRQEMLNILTSMEQMQTDG